MRACATCEQRFSAEAAFCPFDGTPLEDETIERPRAAEVDEIGPGSILGGHYRVDRVLGEGGMGIVYAVTHTRLNKRFALKLLKRELAREEETRARFLQEAQAAGQIHHPNVVEITDYAPLADGSAYLVMEYLDGQPLAKMIKLGGALPAGRAVSIVRDVASALQAAHDVGIVHRDLKPDNVFVLDQTIGGVTRELAKILDFGVAKVAGGAKLTRTGMVFGTPHYMSPEQASGGAVDARTDVYALGVIMYEVFTGRVPFEADTYMGVLTKHMFEAPVPPSQLPGAHTRVLGALEDVTLKALAKRPEERYGSMTELLQDVDRIVQVQPDGTLRLAAALEGLARPDFRAGAEAQRRALAGIGTLADSLEPPHREEITAERGIAGLEQARRRTRTIGIVVACTLTALAGGVAAAHLVDAPPKQNDPLTKKPPAVESPIAEAPPRAPSIASTPAVSAPSVAPSAPSATDPAPSAPPIPRPTRPFTPQSPTPKRHGAGDVDDPWAK